MVNNWVNLKLSVLVFVVLNIINVLENNFGNIVVHLQTRFKDFVCRKGSEKG